MKTNVIHSEKIRTLSKPALAFLLKMLALLTIIKCLFFFYNFAAGSGWQINHFKTAITIIFWSASYDIFVISAISLAMPVLFYFLKKYRLAVRLVTIMFSAVLGFMVFLNLADVFYYPYVLQRSNNELIYELRNPLHNISLLYLLISILAVAIFFIISSLIYRWIRILASSQKRLSNPVFSLVIFSIPILLFIVTGARKILPTYPLVYLKSNQLPLVQNSFHQFIYSLYRGQNAQITTPDYSKLNPEISGFSLIKKNKETGDTSQRNIVLFIMESVPHDFFDPASRYKVKMPFLDSLVTKSLFFNKSYCYSHQSNKGIVAILASTPTLTDIPLYHSSYTNIPMTHVGSALASRGYYSAFFIGDNYDDFGFAKCVNWLGIGKYYCMADIPGHQHMKKHTMGLQDEYVLNFMGDKINAMTQPFFAVNYNISTHYPYDIPADFKEPYPSINRTDAMRSMSYYNHYLEDFFNKAKEQPWFNNTVFIFCSDHWMYPDIDNNPKADEESSFRIALFIYDPKNPNGAFINYPVSQFDILNTILHYANYTEPFISYGRNLIDQDPDKNRASFARNNNILYQAMDSSCVLGFNSLQNRDEFSYHFASGKNGLRGAALDTNDIHAKDLSRQMKAFLITAYRQYKNLSVH